MKELSIACVMSLLMIFTCSCSSDKTVTPDAYENQTTEEKAVTDAVKEEVTEITTEPPEVHTKKEFECSPKDLQELADQNPEDNTAYVFGTLSYDKNGLSISKEDFYSSKTHMVLTGDDGTQIACSFTDLLDQDNFDIIEEEFAGHYDLESYNDKKVYMYGTLSSGCRMINCRPLSESEIDDFYLEMKNHKESLNGKTINIDELEDAFKNDPYDAYIKYNFFRTNLEGYHSASLGGISRDLAADMDGACGRYDFPDIIRNFITDIQWYGSSYNNNAFLVYDSTNSFRGKYFSETGYPVVTCIAAYFDSYVPANEVSCHSGYMLYISDQQAESFKDSSHRFIFYDENEYDHLY